MKQPVRPVDAEGTKGVVASDAIGRQIAGAIGSMRFGSVEITVHDGRIVQIERREKVRLEILDGNPARPTA